MTKPIRLPVLRTFAPPATYGECCEGTPLTSSLAERMSGRGSCEALWCRFNERAVRSENVPGRRNKGIAPEWTLDGEANAYAPSCALDVANAGAHRCSEIAEMFGKSKRRIQQEVKAALLEFKQALIDAGQDAEEVIGAMLAMLEQERKEEMRRKR